MNAAKDTGERAGCRVPGSCYTPRPALDRRYAGSQVVVSWVWDRTKVMGARRPLKRAVRSWPLELLCLALVAGGAEAATPRQSAAPAQKRSVVLITLDTTRADHLGSYGWKFARTP